jgi:hypothetical protein
LPQTAEPERPRQVLGFFVIDNSSPPIFGRQPMRMETLAHCSTERGNSGSPSLPSAESKDKAERKHKQANREP